MSSGTLLSAALATDPRNVTLRLAYADHLDEIGESFQAANQRVVAEPESETRRENFADACEAVGLRDRAAFVRAQWDYPQVRAEADKYPCHCIQKEGQAGRSHSLDCPVAYWLLRGIELRGISDRFVRGRHPTRHDSLSPEFPGLNSMLPDWRLIGWYRAAPSAEYAVCYSPGDDLACAGNGYGGAWPSPCKVWRTVLHAQFKGGFIDSVGMPGPDWASFADTITSHHPVRTVTLFSVPEIRTTRGSRGHHTGRSRVRIFPRRWHDVSDVLGSLGGGNPYAVRNHPGLMDELLKREWPDITFHVNEFSDTGASDIHPTVLCPDVPEDS